MVIADFDNNDPNNGAGNSSAFSSGLSFWAPGESVDVTAEELKSQQRTLQLVEKLIEYLVRDKVDVKHLIQAYQLILDNHITVKGTRRVPSDTGLQLIIRLYDIIEPYRSLLLQTNDHGLYPTREIYDLRCAMYDIIKMYDKFCSNIRDVIVPPTPHQMPLTSAPDAPPTAAPTEPTPGDAGKGDSTADPSAPKKTVDLEELGSYFKADFRGYRGGDDIFSTMIEDAMKLPTQKELGMLAYLLYNSRVLNRHKPRSFSKWIRTFFTLLGKTPPLDTHMNKYEPDEKILRIFAYVT